MFKTVTPAEKNMHPPAYDERAEMCVNALQQHSSFAVSAPTCPVKCMHWYKPTQDGGVADYLDRRLSPRFLRLFSSDCRKINRSGHTRTTAAYTGDANNMPRER